MRKISNFKDDALRDDQFNVLLDVLLKIKNRQDLRVFFATFMTESELAYIGQRLNIMRMLIKRFSYQEIAEKLNVPPNTIYRVNARLESGGQELKKIITCYQYKPKRDVSISKDDNGFIRATRPGAIRNTKSRKGN